MSLLLGTVVATYPEGNSIDVLLDDENCSRLSNVQVIGDGSDISGTMGLPDVGGPVDDTRWNMDAKFALNLTAVIAFMRGCPVAIGFLPPQVTQITFKEKNRRVQRHPSDVYTSTDDAGNFELFHPSGTYLRIGTAAAHEDLTGKDYDKKWAIARNTDKQVHVQLTVRNGGETKSSLNLDPAGNVTLTHSGNLVVSTGGNATIGIEGDADVTIGGGATVDITGDAGVTVGGATTVDSGGDITITAPMTTVEGPLTVNGLLAFTAGMSGSGGSGAAIEGDIISTGGDIVADGISLKDHGHIEQGDGNRTSDSVA